MGLFSKPKQLTKEQLDYVNNLLPKAMHVKELTDKELKSLELKQRLQKVVTSKFEELEKMRDHVRSMPEKREKAIVDATGFFNVGLHDAEPLGLVDVGIVERFTSASTGDRYGTGGVIGAAIQHVAEDVWKNMNSGEKAVEKAKGLLVKKARDMYHNADSIFNFDIDFRELGDSGNVFVYARGTAATSRSTRIKDALDKFDADVIASEAELKRMREEYDKLKENKDNFPTDITQIPCE